MIAESRRLSFDTNALIYLLDRVRPYCDWLDPLFDSIAYGERQAIISVVAEAEVMVQPLRTHRYEEIERLDALLAHRNVVVLVASREIARSAARIRADNELDLPDALIVATALTAGCDALVGNDRECAKRVTEIPYIYLDDAVRGKA